MTAPYVIPDDDLRLFARAVIKTMGGSNRFDLERWWATCSRPKKRNRGILRMLRDFAHDLVTLGGPRGALLVIDVLKNGSARVFALVAYGPDEDAHVVANFLALTKTPRENLRRKHMPRWPDLVTDESAEKLEKAISNVLIHAFKLFADDSSGDRHIVTSGSLTAPWEQFCARQMSTCHGSSCTRGKPLSIVRALP